MIGNEIVGNVVGASGGGLSNKGFLDFSGNVIRGNSRDNFGVWSGSSGIDVRNRIQKF